MESAKDSATTCGPNDQRRRMTTSVQPAGKNPAYRVWRNVSAEARQERLASVIERFVNDEKLADIALSLGISHSALNMALLEYAEDDWRRAQVARALTRLELATDERERASDVLSLARARDAEKSAQWQLERLLRRLYGQEQQQSASQVVIMLGSDLRASQQIHENNTGHTQVIDVEQDATDSESVARSNSGSVEGVGRVEK
jgi:hypothetical protein